MKLNLPFRNSKPRNTGLTMVIDTGLPVMMVKDYLNSCSEIVDYVKLGWGTSLVTQNLEEKIALYKEFDVPISFGGTLFEIAYLQNKLDEFKSMLKNYEIKYVEISNGTLNIDLEAKIKLIEEFSKDFKVLSEVGSKDSKAVVAPKKWVKECKEALSAGAWKVIAEGRESGKAGLFRESGEIRTGLIEELLDDIELEKIIFEAPQKPQQVWFIKQFGSNVNLGNIAFKDVIALETLRLGLRGDTLLHFHKGENENNC
ncbi:phosphosulfolactate synthase [Caminibacter sp.]